MQLPEELLEPAPAYVTGPTWRRLKAGGWYLPDKTLGWELLNWISSYLRSPEDPDAPFLPTLEQVRFLLWWYAVDQTGRYAYRSGVLRRLKGWGKDPLVAVMSLVELCGPVAFSHYENGQPIGKRRASPWVQVAAVSQDQTSNTFRMFPSLITPKLKQTFGLDVNKTIIYSRDGGLIESVTSSPPALEGKRPTLVILNEIQWWTEANSGHEMYQVIEGNVTKRAGAGSRYLAICNAHRPGEESIGERLWDSYCKVLAGDAIDTGILYDSLEAPADTPLSEIPSPDVDPEGYELGIKALRRGLEIARGDAVWLDLDAMIASILDINNPLSESRRKYLNQINATEDAWIAWHEWDRDGIRDTELRLKAGDMIALGFDGSKSHDWTALVACRIDDGALFLLGIWNPEKYGGEVPREQVDAMVHWAFGRYNVVAMRADVREFESYVDSWGTRYGRKMRVKASPGNAVAFDMRSNQKRFALDCEKFHGAVLEGGLRHDGNVALRQHILNAHRHPTNYDAISIRKASKDSSRKIDAAVCAVLAYAARQDYLMSKRNRTGKVAVYA